MASLPRTHLLVLLGAICPPLATAGCTSSERPPSKASPSAPGGSAESALPSALVMGVEFVQQRPGLGGQACGEMLLRRGGWTVDQRTIFRLTEPETSATPSPCLLRSLSDALRRSGVEAKLVQAPARERSQILDQWRALHGDLVAGRASIVCRSLRDQARGIDLRRPWVIFGYESATKTLRYYDPSQPKGATGRISLASFLRQWPVLSAGSREVLRLAAKPVAPPATPTPRATRALTGHLAELRRDLPPAFHVVAEAPFVVIGDEPREVVEGHARSVVRWAAARLRGDLFDKPPKATRVWLLRDRESYERVSRGRFGIRKPPPFGFHLSGPGVIVINIALGRGSVAHELVHAFMETNLPTAPPWFNEGLGALYEAASERDGKIWGHVNWRLAGLKTALRLGKAVPLRKLIAMNHEAFNAQEKTPPHTAYSQAQAICQLLQQRGLLRTMFRALAQRGAESGGYEDLKRVIGARTEARLERALRRFVGAQRDSGGFDADLQRKRSMR